MKNESIDTDSAWLEGMPPVVRLYLANYPRVGSFDEYHRALKRLLPELRKQALWTIENQKDYYAEHSDKRPQGLVINPAAGLQPFSKYGKCLDQECRIKNAEAIARILGLYADCALMGDPFSDHVLLADKWSEDDSMAFFENFSVFARLMPLFACGAFRFTNNFSFWCKDHLNEFERAVDSVADAIEQEIYPGISLQQREMGVLVKSEHVIGADLWCAPLSNKGRKDFVTRGAERMGRAIFKSHLRGEVHETLFNMRRSSHLGAITFSNSRASLMAVQRIDDGTQTQAAEQSVEAWELSRSMQLPWISQLDCFDVVRLRHEADRALPRFREKFRSCMSLGESSQLPRLIAELRAEALEVQSEIEGLAISKERRFRTVSGALGATASVYGFAAGAIPAGAALGGLLSLLGLLHGAAHKEHQEAAKLMSKPGYVLLRARELAEHAAHAPASGDKTST